MWIDLEKSRNAVHKKRNSRLNDFEVITLFYFSTVLVFSCPEHKTDTIRATDLKLNSLIDLIVENCSAHKPQLSAS